MNEAKSVIKQATDLLKIQKSFRDRGMNGEHSAMHMVVCNLFEKALMKRAGWLLAMILFILKPNYLRLVEAE